MVAAGEAKTAREVEPGAESAGRPPSALPGPRSRLRSTWRIMRDPVGFYADGRARYGDTFRVPALNGDVVVSCDPEVIRDLFALRSEAHAPFAVEAFTPLLGAGSLFGLHGEAHRRERKLLMPPFHGSRMRAYGERIREAARHRLDGWGPGDRVRLVDELLVVSIEVIVQAVFGVCERPRVVAWTEAISRVVRSIHPVLVFFRKLQRPMAGLGPWDRYLAAQAELDRLLYGEIDGRRRSGARGDDILSLMLDATYEEGAPMSREAVRDELLTLLFAGHETTQIAMAWAVYRLHERPDALARLRDELADAGDEPEAVARLPWLSAVCDETLRLDVIVPDVIRTLTADARLGGWALPAGTNVAAVATLVHQRDDLYPEPEAWRPERFLEGSFRPHEYLPFGGGTRRCIGAALALYEMKIVLATMLQGWELRLDGPDVAVRRNLTMGPKRGIPVEIVGRRTG